MITHVITIRGVFL